MSQDSQHIDESLKIVKTLVLPLLEKANSRDKLRGRYAVNVGGNWIHLNNQLDIMKFKSGLDKLFKSEANKEQSIQKPIVQCKLLFKDPRGWDINMTGYKGECEFTVTFFDGKFQNIPITDSKLNEAIEKYIENGLSDLSKNCH